MTDGGGSRGPPRSTLPLGNSTLVVDRVKGLEKGRARRGRLREVKIRKKIGDGRKRKAVLKNFLNRCGR